MKNKPKGNLFKLDIVRTFDNVEKTIGEYPLTYFVGQELPRIKALHKHVMEIEGMEQFYDEDMSITVESTEEEIVEFLIKRSEAIQANKAMMASVFNGLETILDGFFQRRKPSEAKADPGQKGSYEETGPGN